MAAVAIVPAAGKAERFGGGKLLAFIDGEPLLNRTIRSLLDGGVARVIVVLAPEAVMTGVSMLQDPRVRTVVNPDPSRGMFSSIQTGVAAAEGDPILVLPADMPFVQSATVAAVLEAGATTGKLASPLLKGRHGHPVALPGRLRAEILGADPFSTLAAVIAAHEGERVDIEVADPGVRRDVDTPADLLR